MLRRSLRSVFLALVLLSLCAGFALLSLTTPVAHAAAGVATTGASVQVWLTTTDGVNQLAQQANQAFTTGSGSASSTINVNENQQFQQMMGFGAAMTDTSAYLIGTQMSSTQRTALMQALFSPTSGIGVSFVRIPMGSSDFTATPPSNPVPYSYDDLPAGQTDPSLTQFSISHDTAYIIPTLQQALQINPNLKFMANPWSPPPWMKTNNSMINGGNLISSDYGPLAQYFVKFIQTYQAQGIPIYAITPQNEPDVSQNYSSMLFPATNEATFIGQNLGPALANAGLSTQILALDEGSDATYPETVLSNSTANPYLSGIAWHCYSNNLSTVMSQVHSAYPSKDVYETECSTGPTGIAAYSAIDVTLISVQNWAKTVELWNLALNPAGGPKMGSGCTGCTGLVTIDPSTGNATFTQNYYQLGQVSKFVVPGAYHIGASTNDSKLNTAAFKDPDGSKVLVVHNTSSASDTFNVNWDGTQSFTYTLPAGAIVTFAWSGAPIPLKVTYTSMAPNADGCLEAFTRGTDNQIYHNYQLAPSGGWSGWNVLQSGYSFNGDPVMGVNANGMLEVFARGLDNNIWITWQNTVNSSTSWATWVALPSGGNTYQFQGTPSVTQNSDGHLEVIARRNDGTIWHNYQLAPHGSWSGWSAIQVSGPVFNGDPMIATNGDGRLEAFARGSDNNMWHAWEQTANASTSWANWTPVIGSSQFEGTPSVVVNSDGRMEVAARLSDGTIWHTYQNTPSGSNGGGWSNWAAVQPSGPTFHGDPLITANADGHLEIFAVGSDNTMWHIWQQTNGWSNWYQLQPGSGNQFQGVPDAALDAGGRVIVNSIGPVGNSNIWTNFQNSANGATGWYGWVLFTPNGQFQ